MRQIKFRAWHESAKEMIPNENQGFEGDVFNWKHQGQPIQIMQYFDLQDKNGIDYCVGDLVNVFFTSNNGEHNHDCIYEVCKGALGGIELQYRALMWESHGWNQYTLHSTLSEKYSRLSEDYLNRGILMLEDSYGTNSMSRERWKEIDESRYFEIIGNIHLNPELIK